MIYETPNLLECCREYPMNGVIGKSRGSGGRLTLKKDLSEN